MDEIAKRREALAKDAVAACEAIARLYDEDVSLYDIRWLNAFNLCAKVAEKNNTK